MALERLQQCIPSTLDIRQLSYPSRYAVAELLSYYARCWCEYKRTAVYLEASLLNCRPEIENEPLCVVDKFRKTRTTGRLTKG
jgi:uncharacterized Fe-S cluster-containing protein